MDSTSSLASYFSRSHRNAILSWLFVAILVGAVVAGVYFDSPEVVLFSVVAVVVIAGPAAKFRDLRMVAPWYFVALVCLPILIEAFVPITLATDIVPSLAVATLGLLITVEVDRFTSLRLVPWFAVTLTVLLTLSMAGLLNILRWSSDVVFSTTFLLDGRSVDAVNAAVMIEFIYATVAGLLAGVIFHMYFRRASDGESTADVPSTAGSSSIDSTAKGCVQEIPNNETDQILARKHETTAEFEEETKNVESVRLSDRLEIATRRQVQLVRFMQIALVAILAYGLWSQQIAVVTNAALALGVTFLPAVLKRDYEVSIEPGLILWVVLAVFLHALGTAGLYDMISRWDYLTHTLSATVVAATGYAALRAVHLHSDEVNLPPWALFGCLLVFMLAMSVIWEIMEFFVDQSALLLDMDPILAQHGINDTIVDMIFNLVGSVIVAIWGTVYLTEVSESLASVLEERLGTRK